MRIAPVLPHTARFTSLASPEPRLRPVQLRQRIIASNPLSNTGLSRQVARQGHREPPTDRLALLQAHAAQLGLDVSRRLQCAPHHSRHHALEEVVPAIVSNWALNTHTPLAQNL